MKTLDQPGPFRETRGTRCEARVGVRIAVSFTDDEFSFVQRQARDQGVPVATLVRQYALGGLRAKAEQSVLIFD